MDRIMGGSLALPLFKVYHINREWVIIVTFTQNCRNFFKGAMTYMLGLSNIGSKTERKKAKP